MAPPAPYRPQNNRRQNRTGYVDHDVFEGLPVRHWRRDYVTVAPAPPPDSTPAEDDTWAVELPHGMPKDSHLLPQHSQDLLRAARSGRIFKRPAPAEEEEVDTEAISGDKVEKKDDDPKNRGFMARAWKQVPRHLEGPDVEYLAKRRKGLITVASQSSDTVTTYSKATVKRIDAAGNEYIQDVVVPQGQQVEGEIISQTIIQNPNTRALGDGPLAPPAPSRRKGPPPKKKPKSTGKGKKKKAMAPTSAPQIPNAEAVAQSSDGAGGVAALSDVKTENENGAATIKDEDVEKADDQMVVSDDDEGEEGEEGEEGDDDEETPDNHDSPSKQPPSPVSGSATATDEISSVNPLDTEMTGVASTNPPMLNIDRERMGTKAGSPLKNVALTTSTIASPLESPTGASPAQLQEPGQKTEPAAIDEAVQREVVETAPTIHQSTPPEPAMTEVDATVETGQEEDEMLLDTVDNTNSSDNYGNKIAPTTAPKIDAPIEKSEVAGATPSEPVESQKGQETEPRPLEPQTVEKENVESAPPADNAQAVEDDAGDFPDLLGGLEKKLNEPVAETHTAEPVSDAVEKQDT